MRKGRFAGLSATAIEAAPRLFGLFRGPGGGAPSAADAERAGRFVADFEESGCGWFWETNADGMLTYLSEPLAQALGRERRALIGRRFEELLLIEDLDGSDSQRPTLGFHLASRFPFTNVIVAPNGRKELCWSLAGRPCFDGVGRFLGFRGIGLNLADQQRTEVRSSRLAARDSLTGLANRGRMRAMLDEALANSTSRNEGCGLFMIDLDRFKQVNDTLGHPVGDQVLQEVARRLSAAIDGEGQVGRLGGDEFEVLLPGIDEEGRLAALAERVIGKLSAPYAVRGHNVAIGASIGIAISRPGRTLADALVKEADLALYAAKGAGRGTFLFFEPEMHAQQSEREMLESDLGRAIADGQLRLVFQPVVSSASEDLVGFEALLRWAHPVRGLLSPADFLPIAEASGLIAGVGEWVIRTACAEAAKWPVHLRLAINLSAAELEQPRLAAILASALAASGLDPGRVELDLAEAALLGDGRTAGGLLPSLKALGLRLALDDYGLGPTSIASLQSPLLDRVKIHPAMLRAALAEDGRAGAVLSGVVGLAAGLGIDVTAEGAETLEDLALIRQLGCSEIQGFLFGRPIGPKEALDLAAASKPMNACEQSAARPPRHSLIRRAALISKGGSVPVRLRNISAGGAMIESAGHMEPGAEVELDLSAGVRLKGNVRWSQDGRIGVRFAESFNLQRLGRTSREPAGLLKPDYLKTETKPDSPWAGRHDRLTIKDVRSE